MKKATPIKLPINKRINVNLDCIQEETRSRKSEMEGIKYFRELFYIAGQAPLFYSFTTFFLLLNLRYPGVSPPLKNRPP